MRTGCRRQRRRWAGCSTAPSQVAPNASDRVRRSRTPIGLFHSPEAPPGAAAAIQALAEPLTVTYSVTNSLDDVNEVASTFDAFALHEYWSARAVRRRPAMPACASRSTSRRATTISSARIGLNSVQTSWISMGFEIEMRIQATPPCSRPTRGRRAERSPRPACTASLDTQWLQGTWYAWARFGPAAAGGEPRRLNHYQRRGGFRPQGDQRHLGPEVRAQPRRIAAAGAAPRRHPSCQQPPPPPPAPPHPHRRVQQQQGADRVQ